MSEGYEPSADFVEHVMARVRRYEAERVSFQRWLVASRPIRYALAGGGTVFGILNAVPVF